MEGLTKFLSLGPVLLVLWLSVQATLLIAINILYPDLLFYPLS